MACCAEASKGQVWTHHLIPFREERDALLGELDLK